MSFVVRTKKRKSSKFNEYKKYKDLLKVKTVSLCTLRERSHLFDSPLYSNKLRGSFFFTVVLDPLTEASLRTRVQEMYIQDDFHQHSNFRLVEKEREK